jgi:hypothetical protein
MLRFGLGRTATYRRVKELVSHGLVERHRLIHADDGILTATKDGLRFARIDHLTLASISLASVSHTLACATVTASIERDLSGGGLLTEREHRATEARSGRPLGSAVVGHTRSGQRRLHQPDMVVIWDYPRGGLTAIEVELTVKRRERIDEILRGYRRNNLVTAVQYYAPATVAEVVQRATVQTGTTDLVSINRISAGQLAKRAA